MQAGREQPTAAMAMTVTTDDSIEWSDKYSHNAQVNIVQLFFDHIALRLAQNSL